jgi:hypothetical protein
MRIESFVKAAKTAMKHLTELTILLPKSYKRNTPSDTPTVDDIMNQLPPFAKSR